MPNGEHHISHEEYHKYEEEERRENFIIAPMKVLAENWISDNLPPPISKHKGKFVKSGNFEVDLDGGILTCRVTDRGCWDVELFVKETNTSVIMDIL